MKYELKYEDFSKDPVSAVPGDILVLVCQDGHREIFRAVSVPNKYSCKECHLDIRANHRMDLICTRWNLICPHDRHIIYTSIDTLLEDL